MFQSTLSSRVITAIAMTALLLGVGFSPANAAVGARTASATQQLGSGTWSAVATASATAPFGTGPLALSFPAASLIKYKFFTLANTGTLSLLSATVSVPVVPASATVLIESCTAAWNESLNLCVGGVARTVVSSATVLGASTAFAAASLTGIRLRASLVSISLVDVAAIVNVAVPRSGARVATVTP